MGGDSEALSIVDVCESPVTWDSFRRACNGAAMIAVCAHERPRPAPRKSRLMIGYRSASRRRELILIFTLRVFFPGSSGIGCIEGIENHRERLILDGFAFVSSKQPNRVHLKLRCALNF